ncbi:hypothetical protein [Chryseobacterium sp. ISL-6]|uniref:hypothetical protein n=1 Tax=Chryseobacterium sp. ISL-6 TaxID=2819143 RepID=UPI001BE9CF09|nr:hypothetical protein [Chryseobacterium sp. ISL-6]MBT2620782.1 hypothetical protein [Chryseobacterium sp. ISL-6]
MKYLRFFIVFIVFATIVIFFKKTGAKEDIRLNNVLNNNVELNGYVTNIKQSRNHAFGIIQLRLTHSSIKEFNKSLNDTVKNGIYPYRIEGSLAELYTIIPGGINEGDSVRLKSCEKNSHYYNVQTKQSSEGYIWVVANSTDIDFVKENTMFK